VTALATTAVVTTAAQMTLQLVCTPLRSDTGSLSSESTEPLTVESVLGCRSPWLAEGAQLRWWGRTSDQWSSSRPSGMPRTRTGSGAVPAGTSRTTIALDVGHSPGPWSPTTPADRSRNSRRRHIHAQCRTRRLGIPVTPGPNRLARARRCWERLLLINGRHDSASWTYAVCKHVAPEW
jgi:hypothetical protein